MRTLVQSACALGIVLAATACAKQSGVDRVDTIYMFAGTEGAMAYSIDSSGANLPAEYGPWRFRQEVSTDGSTFKAGADKRALEEVKARGYSITVFTITIEGLPPNIE